MASRPNVRLWLVAAIAALAVIPALAAAHTVRSQTTVTIHFKGSPTGDKFSGKVRSPRPACERNRLIRLIQGEHDAATVIASTRSDASGKWEIDPPGQFVAPGSYKAKVTRRKRARPGHLHICRPTFAKTTVG